MMHTKSRQVPRVAIAFLLMGASLGAAQAAPDYSRFNASQLIPFANQENPPFTNAPQLRVTVTTKPWQKMEVQSVQMDTGSTGILISSDQIPDYKTLRVGRKLGYQFLSSSKILFVGTWVPVTVTFYDASGKKELATASVLALGVEQSGPCSQYKGGSTCLGKQPPSASGRGIFYMGVGFGQEADFMPQATPDKNPLLNLTTINGKPIEKGEFKRGYIIDDTGVTIGLTSVNTKGFGFIKLHRYTPEFPTDWRPASMCVQINGSACGEAMGTVLVDTGIPQSYITVPPSVRYTTVPDLSAPSLPPVLAKNTTVVVNLPPPTAKQPNPVAVYDFKVGEGKLLWEPLKVVPLKTQNKQPFVNTGRHFLRMFQFLYDAENGYIGLKQKPSGKHLPGD